MKLFQKSRADGYGDDRLYLCNSNCSWNKHRPFRNNNFNLRSKSSHYKIILYGGACLGYLIVVNSKYCNNWVLANAVHA